MASLCVLKDDERGRVLYEDNVPYTHLSFIQIFIGLRGLTVIFACNPNQLNLINSLGSEVSVVILILKMDPYIKQKTNN